MENKNIEILKKLGDALVFKFNTITNGKNFQLEGFETEEHPIFKEYDKEELKEFNIFLASRRLAYFPKKFKKFKRDTDYDMPIVLDWDKIFTDKEVLKETNMFSFFTENPITFEKTFNKSKYLADIEDSGYIEPSYSIASLDQMVLTYFTDKDMFDKNFNSNNEDLKISDVFSNLIFFINVTGRNHNKLFSMDTYGEIMKEFGKEITNKEMFELEATAMMALENNKQKLTLLSQQMRIKRK